MIVISLFIPYFPFRFFNCSFYFLYDYALGFHTKYILWLYIKDEDLKKMLRVNYLINKILI